MLKIKAVFLYLSTQSSLNSIFRVPTHLRAFCFLLVFRIISLTTDFWTVFELTLQHRGTVKKNWPIISKKIKRWGSVRKEIELREESLVFLFLSILTPFCKKQKVHLEENKQNHQTIRKPLQKAKLRKGRMLRQNSKWTPLTWNIKKKPINNASLINHRKPGKERCSVFLADPG